MLHLRKYRWDCLLVRGLRSEFGSQQFISQGTVGLASLEKLVILKHHSFWMTFHCLKDCLHEWIDGWIWIDGWMLSSQMEEQKALACLLSWLTSKPISRLFLVLEFDLLSWTKGVDMIWRSYCLPTKSEDILQRTLCPLTDYCTIETMAPEIGNFPKNLVESRKTEDW